MEAVRQLNTTRHGPLQKHGAGILFDWMVTTQQESWSEQTEKLLKIADAARERLNEIARKAILELMEEF